MWDKMLSCSPLANFFWDLQCKIYFLLVGKKQSELYLIATMEMFVGFIILNLKAFLLYCQMFLFQESSLKAFNRIVSPCFISGAINF